MKIGRIVGAWGAVAGLVLITGSASALPQEADSLSIPQRPRVGGGTYSRVTRLPAGGKSSFSRVMELEVMALLLTIPPVTFALLRRRRVKSFASVR
jgi:hypothetical protein